MKLLRRQIKEIMASQGWETVSRPDPEIIFGADRNSYCPEDNCIRIKDANHDIIAHELCHSLQPIPDIYIDKKSPIEYMHQEVERQAYAIGDFFEILRFTGESRWSRLDSRPGRSERIRLNILIRAEK